MSIPSHINVGILADRSVSFKLNDTYYFDQTALKGAGEAYFEDDTITLKMNDGTIIKENEFELTSNNGTFSLNNVTIGIDFHWESKETQTFQGNLKLIPENNKVRAINTLSIEDYLCSVISSEMAATSSMELLKAHTVTSRSWLLAQIIKSKTPQLVDYNSFSEDSNERIKWYDREDHDTFDVCADDHCQRYQGITRIVSPLVKEAVEATNGQVLYYDNVVCDARFSKSCGGVSEQFENCWEPIHHKYLSSVVDSKTAIATQELDFSIEENAYKWIMGTPDTFCNAQDKNILKQVLNDYDQETADFYRWKVEYTQAEISQLFRERSGIDIGNIIELNALKRGKSGRIIRLQVIGTKQTFIIGKELEIRRSLSNSHLYSSAFVIEYGEKINNIPQAFTIHGAGWGHGVGLCQIGAAVMADKGFDYKSILSHYFKNSELKTHNA